MVESLRGKRVLIVGGSSGIGLATANAFVQNDATVVIASRSGEKLAAAAEKLGGRAQTRTLDTTDDAAIDRFFAAAETFDHVVMSAASTKTGAVRELSLADAYAAMNSKFWGAYRVARAAVIAADGSLTLVSGLLGRKPNAAAVLQGAINAALEALGRGLALELSPVRVNTVSPGLIDTPLHDRLPADKRQALFEQAAARLPTRQVGQPESIANAVLYLATTPFASGSTVFVDGGAAII